MSMALDQLKIDRIYHVTLRDQWSSSKLEATQMILKYTGSFVNSLVVLPLVSNKNRQVYTNGLCFVEKRDVRRCREIPATDLPLYLNWPQIYPAFQEALNAL